VALGVVVGSFVSFLLGIFNPAVINKAGPDWMWAGGRNDIIRNLYFKPNGSFRRYGRLALLATLFAGWIALSWLAQHA
jgi:membrane protein YqaA with SNARE-associated domain